MNGTNRLLQGVSLVLLLSVGCGGGPEAETGRDKSAVVDGLPAPLTDGETAEVAAGTPAPGGGPGRAANDEATGAGPTNVPAFDGFRGTVVETMNTGPYTYLRVDTGDEKRWVAAPRFEVAVGDAVAVPRGMEMRNFRSSTLNRSFDRIYFVGNVHVPGKTQAASPGSGGLPAGHPPLPGPGAAQGRAPATEADKASSLPAGHPPVAQKSDSAVKMDLSGIDKAEGGKTVAEIHAAPQDLAGKEVLFRGKVVKFNGGILGRNWLHVQDGSGKSGLNDLTVTTNAVAKVGDTVLVRGTLRLNRDFGAGYNYAVIVEDATVTVE